MIKVTLGNRVYFILEEKDRDEFEDFFDWRPEVVEVDGDRTQPVINDIIIKAVKAEAAKSLPPKKKTAAASQPRGWKVVLKQWLDHQDMPKVKTPDGEFWRVRRKRKDVYAELGGQPVLKITIKSFERMTRPDSFPYKGFPLLWGDD